MMYTEKGQPAFIAKLALNSCRIHVVVLNMEYVYGNASQLNCYLLHLSNFTDKVGKTFKLIYSTYVIIEIKDIP